MKKLKKLNRDQRRQINGGGINKCSETRPCFIGFCCRGLCMEYDCID
ncbi:hypothetical protein [Chryseobacterium carnipullorum]|nr:hypothetical protein [Chryseobacterium carnipullorum]